MPKLKWLSRDNHQQRARMLGNDGYALWVTKPELDGWWIAPLHGKNSGYVEIARKDAKTLVPKDLQPGDCVKLDPPVDASMFASRRFVPCAMEERMGPGCLKGVSE